MPKEATHPGNREMLTCAEVGHLMVRGMGSLLRHTVCPRKVLHLRIKTLIYEIR
jgi:hypothetical protein